RGAEDRKLRPAPAFGKQLLDLIQEMGRAVSGAQESAEPLRLWDRRGDHREPRGQVLAQLQGIGREREFVDHEGANSDIEAFAVSRKLIVASSSQHERVDRKSTRLNSSHVSISYAVFCLKKKKKKDKYNVF